MEVKSCLKKIFVSVVISVQAMLAGCSGNIGSLKMENQEEVYSNPKVDRDLEVYRDPDSKGELNIDGGGSDNNYPSKNGGCLWKICIGVLIAGVFVAVLAGGEGIALDPINKDFTKSSIPNCYEGYQITGFNDTLSVFGELNTTKVCTKCNENFYPSSDGSECLSISSVLETKDCETPVNSNNGNVDFICSECTNGTVKTPEGECVSYSNVYDQIISPFINCQAVQMNNNNGSSSPEITCSICKQGFYPDQNGGCTSTPPIIQNCITIADSPNGNSIPPICDACSSGYNLTPMHDSCIPEEVLNYMITPTNVYPNANSLCFTGPFGGRKGTTNFIGSCVTGYVPNEARNACVKISTVFLPNCETLTNNPNGNNGTYCEECNNDYYNFEGSCQNVSDIGTKVIGTMSGCTSPIIGPNYDIEGCFQCEGGSTNWNIANEKCSTNQSDIFVYEMARCTKAADDKHNNGKFPVACYEANNSRLTAVNMSSAGYLINLAIPIDALPSYSVAPPDKDSNALSLSFYSSFNCKSVSDLDILACKKGFTPSSDGQSCIPISGAIMPDNCVTIQDNNGGNSLPLQCSKCADGYFLPLTSGCIHAINGCADPNLDTGMCSPEGCYDGFVFYGNDCVPPYCFN